MFADKLQLLTHTTLILCTCPFQLGRLKDVVNVYVRDEPYSDDIAKIMSPLRSHIAVKKPCMSLGYSMSVQLKVILNFMPSDFVVRF